MTLKVLSLENIRSYSTLDLILSEKVTALVGPNASGKTTIVEAIDMLATGNSFRAGKIDEVIKFDQEIGRIKGLLNGEEVSLELTLTHGMVQGKKTAKRLYSVNGVRRQKRTFTQNLSTVIFRPEDMRLIEGSPTRRRNFMDETLTQVSRDYERSLHTYNQTLIRRNRLLHNVREGEQRRSSLEYWNLSLIKHGEILQEYRKKLLHFLSIQEFETAFTAHYQPSLISEERIAEYADREIAAGHTLVGPHKDDLMVEISKVVAGKHRTVAVDSFGSRGEQRLAVLWLKLGQIKYLETELEEKPVLLLDDILSELDDESQQIAVGVMKKYQSVVTSTDPQILDIVKSQHQDIKVIKTKPGNGKTA